MKKIPKTNSVSLIFTIHVYKSANFIICGDLNGHSPLWGSSKTDRNGKIIEDIIEKHDLVCVNNGSGTRMNTHTGKTTCIYITLTSKTIAAKCSWQVLEDNWSSDHFPVIIEYKNTCFQTSYKYTPRWSYKQANWEKFQDSCNELISELDQTTNIDKIYDVFMVQLNNACNTAIPETKHDGLKLVIKQYNRKRSSEKIT